MRTKHLTFFLMMSVGICPLLYVRAIHPMAQSINGHSSESESNYASSEENNVDSITPTHYLGGIIDGDLSRMYLSRQYMKPTKPNNFFRSLSGFVPGVSSESWGDSSEEKRGTPRNFIRFGRGSKQNFLRFGRQNDLSDKFQWSDEDSDSLEELLKRAANNIFRYSRASNRNFLRFGRSTASNKNKNLNFLRFGRSSNIVRNPQHPLAVNLNQEDDNSKKISRSSPSYKEANIRKKRSLETASVPDKSLASPPLGFLLNLPFLDDQNQISDEMMVATLSNYPEKRPDNPYSRRYGRFSSEMPFIRYGRGKPANNPKIFTPFDKKKDPQQEFQRSMNFIRYG